MTIWQAIPGEQRQIYSPIGLRLIDDFTGLAPQGSVRASLDVRNANGEWRPTGIGFTRTPSDVIIYPGLGRSANVALQPAFHYRVRLEAAFYRPEYLTLQDGIEFDAHPYDDDTPPAVMASLPDNTFLIPATNYPYPSHVRVVRGQVVDTVGDPVANVEITEGGGERVLSDERGTFSLPLRWPPFVSAVQIDAMDFRAGRSGQLNINLPADLASGHVVVIM